MKSATRLAALIAASLTAIALVLPLGACGLRRADPAKPERSWSSNRTPVRYARETANARDDIVETPHLTDEHGVDWFHYAPLEDNGIRVFFPAAPSCSYRLIVSPTVQYIGVSVVEGSAEGSTCDPRTRTTDRYASMSADLGGPMGNRHAVELADLTAAAIGVRGDGPNLGPISTDASMIPEAEWARNPDGDLIFLERHAYARVDWTEDVASADLTPAGNIGRTVSMGAFLRDWDATRLAPGTRVLRPRDRPHPLMLYAETEGTLAPYLMLVEG